MTESLPNSAFTKNLQNCRHRTRNGGRCRLPVRDANTGYCFRHASLRNQNVDGENLTAELVGQLTEFHSASEVKEFLGKLLFQLVKNRISNKRAAVLTYIASQLLHSFREIELENRASANDEDVVPQIIIDMPRPMRERSTVSSSPASPSDGSKTQ